MTSSVNRAQQALFVQRLVLSGIIAAHGLARLFSDAVEPFGVWLESQNLPVGILFAYAITAIEIIGAPLLALGLFVSPLCLVYSGIYLVGIFLVHLPDGWFVVGLGRNGMEYSVLLIVCLLSNAYWQLPDFSREGDHEGQPHAGKSSN